MSKRRIRQLSLRQPGTNLVRQPSVRIISPTILQGSTSSSTVTNTSSGAVPFVFRPAEPNPQGNVFATWGTLYASLQLAQGTKVVLIDTTLAAASIPVGSYNLLGVTFKGFSQDFLTRTVLSVADGAEIIGLAKIENLELRTETTGANQLVFPQPNPLFIIEDALLTASGVAPIQYNSTGLTISLLDGGSLGDDINPVFRLGATGSAIVIVDGASTANDNSVEGVAGSTVSFVYEFSSLIPDSLPGFLGTRTNVPRPPLVANVLYVATNGNDVSGDGSKPRPLATLQEALNRSSDFTDIRVQAGVYDGAVIPTTPPRSSLSISAEGFVVIGQNLPASIGLDLQADASNADGILSLRLQGLRIQGETGLRIANSNPANDDFLREGLFLDGCEFIGSTLSASIERAGQFFAQGNLFRGPQLIVGQIGTGQWIGSNSNGTCTFFFDSTQPFPSGGTDFVVDSSNFEVLEVQGSNTLSFGSEVRASDVIVSPRELGGDPLQFAFDGKADLVLVDFQSTDTVAHQVSFDRSQVGNLSGFFDVLPASSRQAISLRNAVTEDVSADAQIDIDLVKSSNSTAISAGAGPNAGSVQRVFTENIIVNIASTPLTFTTPLSNANYTVSFELSDFATVRISNKTRFGFDYEGTAGPIGGLATITPINF